MRSNWSLLGLLLLGGIIQSFSQDENKTDGPTNDPTTLNPAGDEPKTDAHTDDPTTPKSSDDAPKTETHPDGATTHKPSEDAPKTESHPDDATTRKPSQSANETNDVIVYNCEPDEVMTQNKGCVNRDELLDSVVNRVWDDENLDDAKKKAGFMDKIKCKDNEILTPFGCAEKPRAAHRRSHRAPVGFNILAGNKVLKAGSDKATYNLEEPLEPRHSNNQHHHGSNRPGAHGSSDKSNGPDTKLYAHNRPRKYVFLPGRRLSSGRRCRPYEVMGRNHRCIRKRGKNGVYKHKNHKYGLQLRHRHPAATE
ncbi:uncharacterized protein LOC115621492 [Scaptodrosophila lebanonensis]|uniref:Uncharacterized protein LOC115621492 n=1 Tax=Drosophila lebanonensis TaxID=7225 RepID=A0A6J2T6V9_DROLE|nr:uncharacterized protein LOC115621492 [Scaptodrosophila lebanonensis]